MNTETDFRETPILDGMGPVPRMDEVPLPGVLSDEDLVAVHLGTRGLDEGWPHFADFALPEYPPLSYEDEIEVGSQIEERLDHSGIVIELEPQGPEDTARWTPVFDRDDE